MPIDDRRWPGARRRGWPDARAPGRRGPAGAQRTDLDSLPRSAAHRPSRAPGNSARQSRTSLPGRLRLAGKPASCPHKFDLSAYRSAGRITLSGRRRSVPGARVSDLCGRLLRVGCPCATQIRAICTPEPGLPGPAHACDALHRDGMVSLSRARQGWRSAPVLAAGPVIASARVRFQFAR